MSPTAARTPVIVDCDPGHDDALALFLAAGHPKLDLLAITTVAGNQTLEKCTLNARRVCTVAGITDVPIAAGADRPLRRELRVAAGIHGDTGVDGPTWPDPVVDAVDEPAVELIHRILREQTEPVTLIPIGPLTNIATLLDRHPEARDAIGGIVLMGGSTGRGNVTPYAEFNIHVDPEAAAMVFGSGIPVTMVGLNVTHKARVGADIRDRMRDLDSPVGTVCADLMDFYGGRYDAEFGFDAPPLHDPIAVAHVIDPNLLTCRSVPVAIEVDGTHTAGATVVDLAGTTGAPPNASVGVDLDVDGFFDLLLTTLARF